MSGKCRPSLRRKILENVKWCNLSHTDKNGIVAVFELAEKQQAEIKGLRDEIEHLHETIEDLWETIERWDI